MFIQNFFSTLVFTTMVTETPIFEIPDSCLGNQSYAINYHGHYQHRAGFQAWITTINDKTFVVGHEVGVNVNKAPIKILGKLISWRKNSEGVEYTYAPINPEYKEVREKILTLIKEKNKNRKISF